MKQNYVRFISFLLLSLPLIFNQPSAFAADSNFPKSLSAISENSFENTGAEAARSAANSSSPQVPHYTIGPDDILEISVLRPEVIMVPVTVSADGFISFPYIGSVLAKGKTPEELQTEIAERLGNGYMKYPVVTVALKESHSRKFFIYGEVVRPGSYPMEENMTVFRALAVAGGFTKFGNASKVKILRPKANVPGYEMIKVDIRAIMDGSSQADVMLLSGDVIVVSEGVF